MRSMHVDACCRSKKPHRDVGRGPWPRMKPLCTIHSAKCTGLVIKQLIMSTTIVHRNNTMSKTPKGTRNFTLKNM
jgi:hypothetical protein